MTRFYLLSVLLLPSLLTVAESFHGVGRHAISILCNPIHGMIMKRCGYKLEEKNDPSRISLSLEKVNKVGRGGVSLPFFNRHNKTASVRNDEQHELHQQQIAEEFEFPPELAKKIQNIADVMLFLGYQGIFFGWVKLGLGFCFISTQRRPFRIYPSDALEVSGQLVEMYIAKLLRDGGLAFQRIVQEEGHDIENLFKGLDSFQKIMQEFKNPTLLKWAAVIGTILSLTGALPRLLPGFSTYYNAI